jgi:hypothetical protein
VAFAPGCRASRKTSAGRALRRRHTVEEEINMNTSIRWRVMVLQGLAGIVLLFVAAFAFGASSFVHNTIREQLVAQKISFPASGSPALKPSEFPDLQQYAGQQVDNGDKARAYANGFIGRHLKTIANGLTYSQVSAKALASPNDPKLAAQVQLLFRGETLRGLLLNAYGWWTVGTYAFWAGLGLLLAGLAVIGAFLFEAQELPMVKRWLPKVKMAIRGARARAVTPPRKKSAAR